MSAKDKVFSSQFSVFNSKVMKYFINTKYLILAILMLCIASTASADIPPRPKTTSDTMLVYDYANVIDAANLAVINDSLKSLFRYNGAQVVVLTVNSLDGMEIEDYGLKVLRSWGIGDKEKNNGVLILIKPKTEQSKGCVRIETGYGAEGALPDVLCKQLQTDSMIPSFKENDYGTAVRKAVCAITPIMKGEYPQEISAFLEQQKKEKQSDAIIATVIYVILYILICGLIWYFFFMPTKKDWYSLMASPLIAIAAGYSGTRSSGSSHSRGSSSWSSSSSSSSSSSGGGWSWGGGSGGGGGASSSW